MSDSPDSTSLISTSSTSQEAEQKVSKHENDPIAAYIDDAVTAYLQGLPTEEEEGTRFGPIGSAIHSRYYCPNIPIAENITRWLLQKDILFIEQTARKLRKKFGEPPVRSVSAPTPWVVNMLNRLFYLAFLAIAAALAFTFLPGVQIWGLAFGALAALALSSFLIFLTKLNSPDSWKEHCKTHDAWGYVILSVLIIVTALIITNGFSLFGAKSIGISSPVIDTFAKSIDIIEGITSFFVLSIAFFLYSGVSTKWEEHKDAQLQEKAQTQIDQFHAQGIIKVRSLGEIGRVQSVPDNLGASNEKKIIRRGSESDLGVLERESKEDSTPAPQKPY